MDQNIDDDCLQSLFHLRDPKKTIVFDYQLPTCCDQTIYELNDVKKTLEIMDRDYLSQGKLVYICCNSKTKGADLISEYIKNKYPGYSLRPYTSETPENDKLTIGLCEEEWTTSVVVSPTITYGVDHSKADVFSATFCFISKSYSIPANMVVQQLRRVRKLIDGKIFICNESTSYWEKNTMKQIKEQIIQRLTRNKKPKPSTNAQSKRNSITEIADLVFDSTLDTTGRPVLKDSWFSKIYQFYYRSELESRQNMSNWIRGYLCDTGFKYYVLGPQQKQNEQCEKEIETHLAEGEQSRFKHQMQKYVEAPINKEGVDPLSKTKYYHCRSFGLNSIDEPFYQKWIDDQSYRKMTNLVIYLSSQQDHLKKQIQYNTDDYLVTEKNISGYHLFQELLKTVGFDLKSFFFTGMPTTQIPITPILPHQKSFIDKNKRDLLYLFGPIARIRGEMKTSYQLMKYMSRIMNGYLGLEFTCQQKRVKKDRKITREAQYTLTIQDQIYELLSYRVLGDRKRTLRWLFPKHVCSQLKDKYRKIDKQWEQWEHLAICTDWPEIDTIPKIKLKLKLKKTSDGVPNCGPPEPCDDNDCDLPPPKFSPDYFDDE